MEGIRDQESGISFMVFGISVFAMEEVHAVFGSYTWHSDPDSGGTTLRVRKIKIRFVNRY